MRKYMYDLAKQAGTYYFIHMIYLERQLNKYCPLTEHYEIRQVLLITSNLFTNKKFVNSKILID